MTPPVDVGEGLVVEGQAAEENIGAAFNFGGFTVPLYCIGGIVIHTRVIWHLQRGHEGLLAGFQDGLDGSVAGSTCVNSTLHCTDVTVELAKVVNIFGVERSTDGYNLTVDALPITAIPIVTTGTLKYPLEVRTNFSGHLTDLRIKTTFKILRKRLSKISHKSIQTWPSAPSSIKLTLNRLGHTLQPRSPLAITFI
ncbi:aminopeptidase P family protein [Babesia caballi]|uniref:Aminopeptidase P family protein n=1 Tax=Babesia caballi TaxID=5871 RepID=A0AAV4M018_BABCB|nr:aminopeptidase P family protein [Babesia caballi]